MNTVQWWEGYQKSRMLGGRKHRWFKALPEFGGGLFDGFHELRQALRSYPRNRSRKSQGIHIPGAGNLHRNSNASDLRVILVFVGGEALQMDLFDMALQPIRRCDCAGGVGFQFQTFKGGAKRVGRKLHEQRFAESGAVQW